MADGIHGKRFDMFPMDIQKGIILHRAILYLDKVPNDCTPITIIILASSWIYFTTTFWQKTGVHIPMKNWPFLRNVFTNL